jgi:hypothetical protein
MNDQNISTATNSGNTSRTIPADTEDLNSLWIDPKLGDGITSTSFHTVPVGRPRDFFRTHPSADYRRRTEIYVHKPEGAIDEQWFIIAPSMRGYGRSASRGMASAITTRGYRPGPPRELVWIGGLNSCGPARRTRPARP